MPFLVYSAPAQAHWADLSDDALMLALQQGDEQALDELIRRKAGPLLQTVTRITRDREEARDIVQVVFVRVWEKRHSFNRRWSPNTWIFRIAVNLAMSVIFDMCVTVAIAGWAGTRRRAHPTPAIPP